MIFGRLFVLPHFIMKEMILSLAFASYLLYTCEPCWQTRGFLVVYSSVGLRPSWGVFVFHLLKGNKRCQLQQSANRLLSKNMQQR